MKANRFGGEDYLKVKEDYIAYEKEIADLKDKVSRRNMQIKDRDKKINHLKARIADLLQRGICTHESPCDGMTHTYESYGLEY